MKYEIWIGEHYSHYERGVAHLDDGRMVELQSLLHSATYSYDSILFDDVEHVAYGRFPLRWFIKKDALDFYSIGDDTPDVLFHNLSNSDIRIDRFGILRKGESMKVRIREEYSSGKH